jgi:transcriptional regulator with XRE-family HTH domain
LNEKTPLGDKIRQFRKTLGMTQEEFAAELGVEALHISCIERGTRGVTLDRLVDMRGKFNISIDDFLSTADCDGSLKAKWIGEITDALHRMEPLQVCLLKRMVVSMKECGPRST